MPYEEEEMQTLNARTPLGCHLQLIESVGGAFDWAGGVKEFDSLLKKSHGQSEGYDDYFTGTIVSISQSDRKTIKELKKRGFKLLGTQRGGHGAYRMGLWGKGFTLPNAARRKK